MFQYYFNMSETLDISVFILLIVISIKSKFFIFRKDFIVVPSTVMGYHRFNFEAKRSIVLDMDLFTIATGYSPRYFFIITIEWFLFSSLPKLLYITFFIGFIKRFLL